MVKFSRRNFLGSAAAATAGFSALMSAAPLARAQLVDTTKDWNQPDFQRLLQSPARIKQLYDVSRVGSGKFLNNIKNSLNGIEFGFGFPAKEVQVVAALHGAANLMNYDDYVWKKYHIGEWLKVDDPKTGKPAVRNIFYSGKMPSFSSKSPESEKSVYQGTSIEVLQSRGVKFLSCHTANEEQSRVLIRNRHLSQTPDEIVNDWQAHLIPGVLVVAAMVAAIAVLQCEGHYSYITV